MPRLLRALARQAHVLESVELNYCVISAKDLRAIPPGLASKLSALTVYAMHATVWAAPLELLPRCTNLKSLVVFSTRPPYRQSLDAVSGPLVPSLTKMKMVDYSGGTFTLVDARVTIRAFPALSKLEFDLNLADDARQWLGYRGITVIQ